ncbi:YeiH family protein [Rhodopseudomonas sp.]|uniref:YeiH family protein n=1 Tax=Rhodopseudomonas sp. TaxID=1078 RepID=UPI003B3A2C0E
MTTPLNAHVDHHRPAHFAHHVTAIAPGVLLAAAIAAAATVMHALPGAANLSPMLLAIVIGIVGHNLVGTPAWALPGVKFSLRRVLRFAIILLGLQLTTDQLIEVGGEGLAIIAAALLATFGFTVWLGRRLGVDRKLTELIAAGTSICGASAIIATNTVTRADDEDVAYGVACVTVFGSAAMIALPLLAGPLSLDPRSFGLWTGASIHEIAQVVAAAFQSGPDAGEFGTIAKLSRVAMLAPLVIGLGLLARTRLRHTQDNVGQAAPPMPWFVLGFVAMIGVNHFVTIPSGVKREIVALTTFMLSMALAAMGLETDLRKLAARGLRPALLSLAAALFVASFSLTLIKLTGWHG